MTRGRAVLAAVAIVVLAIAALALTLVRADDGSHASQRRVLTGTPLTARPGPQTMVSSVFGDVILRHPSSWRSYESEQGPLSSGPAQLIGYLTDQVVDSPECASTTTKGGSTTTCHSLVEHLAPGGIVITIVTSELNRPITGTTAIAGHPALVTRSETADCDDDRPGKTYEVVAQIQTSAATKQDAFVTRTVVDACAAYPVSAQTRLSIERMLKTARL